jgi:TolB-like protein
VETALRGGAAALTTERLVELACLFAGEFLDRGDLDRCPAFQTWLVARRQSCRAQREAILRELMKRAAPGSAEALRVAEAWTEFAPLDPQAHVAVLATLIAQGRRAEAEERFVAAVPLLRNEGVDSEPLAAAWRTLSKRHGAAEAAALPAAADAAAAKPTALRRASIAILPFQDTGSAGSIGSYAAGLTHDVITRLAKLRSLPVIARGSVFALAEQGFTPDEIARKLGVDYAACGTVRTLGAERLVAVDLVETATGRILWSEQFARQAGDDLKLIDEVGDRIVAALASEIELAERNRAVLKAPNTLDAWEAYHRGLWHMYRFNRPDNDRARTSSANRSASIRPFPGAMPVSPSPIFRTPSCFARTTVNAKAISPSRRRAMALLPMIAIPRRIGRWAGRYGCAARWREASANSPPPSS